MSKKSEKALKSFDEFMDKNAPDDMTDDDFDLLSNMFMKEYNGQIRMNVTEKSAVTSSDFLELAEKTTGRTKKLQYVKEALALDPENFDAEILLIELTCKSISETLEKYEETVERAAGTMKKNGFMTKENIGEFWLIHETRPYMRLRFRYVDLLIGCGMFKKAADECKELLRLCEADNLGVRYTLMHIYAHLEMENEALRLFKKFDGGSDTQMLLPLAMIYYKVGKRDTAKNYLTELAAINKDAKKFFRDIVTGNVDDTMSDEDEFGFIPNTYGELLYDIHHYPFLVLLSTPFFEWADEQLKRKRKSSKDAGKE